MSDKYSRKQVKLESKPLLSPDILSDINKWNSNRQAMVNSLLKFDPSNTNYSIEAGALSGIRPSIGNITNTPNTLTIEAHGDNIFPGYNIDPKSSVSGTADANRRLGDDVFERAPIYSYPFGNVNNDFTLNEIAKGIGQHTNDIKHLINNSCYGGGCDNFNQAKQLFPSLQNLVSPMHTPVSSYAIDKITGQPIPDDWYTNSETGPLYDITQNSTNMVTGKLPWIK